MTIFFKPKATTSAASIKDGTYQSTVPNLKQFANTYGERIGFEFTISGGQFDREKVMQSTAPQLPSSCLPSLPYGLGFWNH